MIIWYSVELLEDGSIYIQSSEQRQKHGCKGKILIPFCLHKIATQIQNENK